MQIAVEDDEDGRMCYCEKCGKALPGRADEYRVEEDKRTKTVCVRCFHAHYRAQLLKLTPRP